MDIKEEKQLLRENIWNILFEKSFSNRPNGDFNKIPDFKGSDIAAKRLANTSEWKNANTIFCSPDSAQIPVRYLALKNNKNLIMASPKLENGYLFLMGSKLTDVDKKIAATKEGAFKFCINKSNYTKIDLVVEGSVAVDKLGNRLGKGGGYGDREIADLFKKRLINKSTPIATTIHPLQIVLNIPLESHDMKLNMIVTTKEIFKT